MALNNFDALRASIQSWMFDRADLAPLAADFIALCEGDLNRVLRTRRQLCTVILMPDGDGKIALPPGYLEFRQVTALTSPRRALEMVAPSYADNEIPFRSAGAPTYFSVDGGTMTILPKTAADIELSYFARLPALSEDMPTNWLLTEFPNIYLYGSLKHACLYIGDAERAATMGNMFNGLLQPLIEDERMAMYARAGTRRSGPTP